MQGRTTRVSLAVAAGLAAACLVRYGPGSEGAIAAFAAAVLVRLAWLDALTRRLPNRIVLPAGALVLAARLVEEPAHWALWLGASVGAAVFFLVPALVSPAALGMGDVKLALLVGAALGAAVVPGLVLAALAAGATSALLVARDGRAALRRTIPFGPYLAFGAVVALLAFPG